MIYRLISYLPFPALYALAYLLYLFLYYVFRYRRATVDENLRFAFPEKNDRQIAQLGRDYYRRLAQVALEILKARRMNREDFLQRAKLVNPELLQQYSNDFQDSVIVLTIHQGNWEWMLHGASSALQIPIDPVYKPLHNKTVDKIIFDIRSQFGSRPLPMDGAPRDILRRRREFRIFVMVADQAPVRTERGHWTRFMNREAKFYLGGESIAKMTRFPVLFARCTRTRTGHYEIEFIELAKPPYDKESHAVTDAYVALAEESIRRQPDSWLWSNRRWKRSQAEEIARAKEDAEAGR